MSKSINIIFQKSSDGENGTIYVRTIENRVSEKRSLKIYIKQKEFEKYFIPDSKRFKKTKQFPMSDHYNSIIEQKLKELSSHGNEISYLPNEKKSFIDFWELCIKDFTNHGTRIKHETILNKLNKYLTHISKSENKPDLLFKDITPTFLKEFRHYLTTNSDPKILSENTVIHYLKVFKSIINQSITDDYYNYVRNPFNSLRFSMKTKTKSVLSEEDIEKLLNTKIEDSNLRGTRDMFLFQMFSNGMRVSDVFLLRWDNIINNRILYTMFKTGYELNIPINLNIGLILSGLLSSDNYYIELFKTEKISFTDEDGNYYDINLVKLDKLINHLISPFKYYNPLVDKLINENHKVLNENMGKIEEYKGYRIEKSNKQIRNYIDLKENLLLQVEKKFLNGVFSKISSKKVEDSKDFVFPVLSNEQFKNIGSDFSKLSLEQYKSIKHHTIVYNRKLKKVQELCGIETNMTSHVSRHSFTNLLLKLDNINLYDVQQLLGHSDIKITQTYLRNGFNIEKTDYLNSQLSHKYKRS